MIEWWIAGTVTLLTLFSYAAFFWKINWVRGVKDYADSRGTNYIISKNRKIGKLPPVYPNGWYGLLESWQLEKGQVKHVAAVGENFAVFRTDNGEARILNAYCPHLGANMGEGGRVRGDCLECPFHSWRFRGDDGRCQEIPYAQKVPESAKTKAWKCCEVNKIIFVWYHAESAEPYWEPEPIEAINNGSWCNQGRNEFLVNCHIQEIPENGADCAHFNTIHGPAIFFKDALWSFFRHSWTGADWSTKMSQVSTSSDECIENDNNKSNNSSNSQTSEHHRAIGKLKHSIILFQRYSILDLNVTADQIGPGYVVLTIDSTFGKMHILQLVTPIEPLLQRVTHVMFSRPLIAPYAKIVLIGECIMFERDVAVWTHKKFEKRPLLVREDRMIASFRRWYEQFYTANSPTYQSVMALDW